MRKWRKEHNAGFSTGFVTNVTIVDANGTAMRATLFNDAVTKFYNMLQPGKMILLGPRTCINAYTYMASETYDLPAFFFFIHAMPPCPIDLANQREQVCT